MYRILLVDDEEMVLKSLKASIDWENYGFEIIGTATSVKDALEKIDKKKPEVVFTDVRMPEIGGLELLSMLKRAKPDILCVVISGYAEFAYVQKALRLEAVGYCLKPFDYDEITSYLKRIHIKLDDQNKSKDWEVNFLELLDVADTDSRLRLEGIMRDKFPDFEKKDLEALYILGTDNIPSGFELICACAGTNKYVCILCREDEKSFLHALFEKSVEDKKIYVGVSGNIRKIEDLERRIYSSRKKAFQHFCEPATEPIVRKVVKNTAIESSQLQNIIHFGSEKRKEFFNKLRKEFEEGFYNMDTAILLYNLIETWLGNTEENEEPIFIWDYDILCGAYGDALQMLDDLEMQLEVIGKTNVECNITNQTFKEIFSFVDSNYKEHISAADIAARFHVNPCYVSQLFKKELGKTFTEYVTSKRIKYACKELRQGRRNISEIAEEAGFSDYFYFSRVFHRVMGCAPGEYRNS